MTNQLFKHAVIIAFLFFISSQLFKVSAEEFDIEYRDFNCSPKLQSVVLIDSENDNIYTCEDIVSLFPKLSDESNYDYINSDTSGNFMLIKKYAAADKTTRSSLVRISNGEPVTLWSHSSLNGVYQSLISPTGIVIDVHIKGIVESRNGEIESVEIISIDGERYFIHSFDEYLPIKAPTHTNGVYPHQWSLTGNIFVLCVGQYDYSSDTNYNSFIFFDNNREVVNVYTYVGSIQSFSLSDNARYFFVKSEMNDSTSRILVDRISGETKQIDKDIALISEVDSEFIYIGTRNEIIKIRFIIDSEFTEVFKIDDKWPRKLILDGYILVVCSAASDFDQRPVPYSAIVKAIDTRENIFKSVEFSDFSVGLGVVNNFIYSSNRHRLIVSLSSRIAIFHFEVKS